MSKKNQEEDPLRKLINEAGAETPRKDFSADIFKLIGEEQKANARLKSLLTQHSFEKVPAHFQPNVMQRIEAEVKKKEAPIIPRPLWFGLAACLALCVAFSFLLSPAPFPLLTHFSKWPSLPDAPLQPGLEIFALALTGLAGLALIDLFLRQKMAINKVAEP